MDLPQNENLHLILTIEPAWQTYKQYMHLN